MENRKLKRIKIEKTEQKACILYRQKDNVSFRAYVK